MDKEVADRSTSPFLQDRMAYNFHIIYNGIYSLGKAKDLVEATRQGEIGNQDSIIRRWALYKLRINMNQQWSWSSTMGRGEE